MYKNTVSPLSAPPWSGLPTVRRARITARRPAVLVGFSTFGVSPLQRTELADRAHACRCARRADGPRLFGPAGVIHPPAGRGDLLWGGSAPRWTTSSTARPRCGLSPGSRTAAWSPPRRCWRRARSFGWSSSGAVHL